MRPCSVSRTRHLRPTFAPPPLCHAIQARVPRQSRNPSGTSALVQGRKVSSQGRNAKSSLMHGRGPKRPYPGCRARMTSANLTDGRPTGACRGEQNPRDETFGQNTPNRCCKELIHRTCPQHAVRRPETSPWVDERNYRMRGQHRQTRNACGPRLGLTQTLLKTGLSAPVTLRETGIASATLPARLRSGNSRLHHMSGKPARWHGMQKSLSNKAQPRRGVAVLAPGRRSAPARKHRLRPSGQYTCRARADTLHCAPAVGPRSAGARL